MLKIGLTGGIGSGKTYVSKIFGSINIPIYNADNRAKYLMNNSTSLITQIKELFGAETYTNGNLNRKHLAKIVFNSPARLKSLNSIVHPAINIDFNNWCKTKMNAPYVLKEAAILFESRSHEELNRTILITAPKEIRIKRVCKRDNCTREEVISRMNNQWATEKLISLADFIVNNDDKQLILPQIIQIDLKIKKEWENSGSG